MKVRGSIYRPNGTLKPAVARWQRKTIISDHAFFCSALARVIDEPRIGFDYALKARVGSRGEILLNAAGNELVFYASQLQAHWKGKEILLTADWVNDKWSLICSVDNGESIYCRRYYDPAYKKLYMIGRNYPPGVKVFFDRLDKNKRITFGSVVIAFDHNWRIGAPVRILEKNGEVQGIRVRDRGEDAMIYRFKQSGKTRYIFVGNSIETAGIPDFSGEIGPPFILRPAGNGLLYFFLGERYNIRETHAEEFNLSPGSKVIARMDRARVTGFRPRGHRQFIPFVLVEDLSGQPIAAVGKHLSSGHAHGIRIVKNVRSFLRISPKKNKTYYYEEIVVSGVKRILGRVADLEKFESNLYSVVIDFQAKKMLLVKKGQFGPQDYRRAALAVQKEFEEFVSAELLNLFLFSRWPDFRQFAGLESGLWQIPRPKSISLLSQLKAAVENQKDLEVKVNDLNALLMGNATDCQLTGLLLFLLDREANLGAHSSQYAPVLEQIELDAFEQAVLWLLLFDDSRPAGFRLLARNPLLLEKLYFEIKEKAPDLMAELMC